MTKKILIALALVLVLVALTSAVVIAQPGPPRHPHCQDSTTDPGGTGTVTCTHPRDPSLTCTITYEDTSNDGHFTPHHDEITGAVGDLCPPALD